MDINYDSLTAKNMVPNGIYTCLIQKIDNTPSAKKGTPQTKFELEIVAPAVKQFAGVDYQTAGQKCSLSLWWTEKAMAGALAVCADLGVPKLATTEEIQEFLAAKLDKCYIDVAIQSQERVLRESPLPGQAPWEAPEMKDENGQRITEGWEISRVTVRPGTLKADDGSVPF